MRSAVVIGALGGLWLAVATQESRSLPKLSQETPPKESTPKPALPKQDAAKLSVLVPFFGNEKCPIDGNAVDRECFLEVDGQRVYLCSVPCAETAKLESAKVLEKAYPELKPAATKDCAVCHAPVEAGKEGDKAAPHTIAFQGQTVRVCGAGCEKQFRQMPGVWLARITYPDVKDVGNLLCPIDDQKVDGVTVVIVKGSLVRLSSHACVAKFSKDPETALAKVKAGG